MGVAGLPGQLRSEGFRSFAGGQLIDAQAGKGSPLIMDTSKEFL
ncbi:hypothetical protein ANCCAN_18692 [Ancylostoma caninum]|uniref:Uncharacterized protein n=1 Tax=Ancylostoma caninum TaxID=29170 RepID=A0A368FTF4_ANCCA|nr:hypothetical protein ANCCAN_18692 [Ancylostoma caninum]